MQVFHLGVLGTRFVVLFGGFSSPLGKSLSRRVLPFPEGAFGNSGVSWEEMRMGLPSSPRLMGFRAGKLGLAAGGALALSTERVSNAGRGCDEVEALAAFSCNSGDLLADADHSFLNFSPLGRERSCTRVIGQLVCQRW